MEAFLNPEVIAGIILAFFFFVKGAALLFTKNNDNGRTATVGETIADIEYKRKQTEDHEILLKKIGTIADRMEEWDDLIVAGKFGSIWTTKEVILMQEKVDRILSDGPWTANINRNHDKLREIKYLLDEIATLLRK